MNKDLTEESLYLEPPGTLVVFCYAGGGSVMMKNLEGDWTDVPNIFGGSYVYPTDYVYRKTDYYNGVVAVL